MAEGEEAMLVDQCLRNTKRTVKIQRYREAYACIRDAGFSGFDLVILDLDLPGAKDAEVLSKINSTNSEPTHRVLFLATKIDTALLGILSHWNIRNTVFRPLSVDNVSRHLETLLIEELPDNFDDAYAEAKKALDRGNIHLAHQWAVNLMGNFHANERTYLLNGDIAMQLGYHLSARRLYHRALAINNRSAPALIGLIVSYLADENLAAASEIAVRIEKLPDEELVCELSKVRLICRPGMHDLAERIAKVSINHQPLRRQASEIVAESLVYKDNASGAHQQLISTHTPEEMLPLFNEIIIKMCKYNVCHKAGAIMDYCLSHFSQDSRLYQMTYNVALMAYKKKNFPVAIAYLDQTLKLRPDFRKAEEMLGKITKIFADQRAS